MLLIKLESASKTATKWWMTTKKKLCTTKQSLLLYSKLKRKCFKSETSEKQATAIIQLIVTSNNTNILKSYFFFLMTGIRTNKVNKIEAIYDNITQSNSTVIAIQSVIKSPYLTFRKHFKLFQVEKDILIFGELIGGIALK